MSQYDEIAADYNRVKDVDPVDNYCLYPSLYGAIGDVRGKRALDLATGNGKVSREMYCQGARYVLGIDDSMAQLKIAARSNPAPSVIAYRLGKVGTLGAVANPFDVITAGWLLHYAQSQAELFAMCLDIKRNLKSDGLFVALNENPSNPLGGGPQFGYTITSESPTVVDGTELTVTIRGSDAETSFKIRHRSMATYHNAMRSAGLRLEVLLPAPTKEGIEQLGREFWRELAKHPTTAIFRATHQF